MVVAMKLNKALFLCAVIFLQSRTCFAETLEISKLFLQVWDEREIPAQVVGVVSEVAIDKGQRLTKGDSLVSLDDEQQLIARDRAKLEVNVAKAKVANAAAKVELKRNSYSIAKGAKERADESNRIRKGSVSQDAIDKLYLAEEEARFALVEATQELVITQTLAKLKECDLAAAELDVQLRKIIAPFDGDVAELNASVSEWVEPGQTLVRMNQIDQLKVEALVKSSANIERLAGQQVTLYLDMENHPRTRFSGEIDYVSGEVGGVHGDVVIRVRVDNRDRQLRPGFQVRLVVDMPAGPRK